MHDGGPQSKSRQQPRSTTAAIAKRRAPRRDSHQPLRPGSRLPSRAAALAFGGAAVIAGLAPYSGEALGFTVRVDPKIEVLDHVVPAIVILVATAFVLHRPRLLLPAMLVIALAGFWMTATHIPLLGRAGAGSIDWPAALWHSVPGIVILAAAVTASGILWGEPDEQGGGAGSALR